MPTSAESFLAIVRQYQENLRTLAVDVKNLKVHEGSTLNYFSDITLATTHLEDAESRLGRIN